MSIKIIAAVAKNNIIGAGNNLPWHIPEDLQHFKNLTSGGTVLMGRKTYESILSRLGKPLPDRVNVVITRKEKYDVPAGVETCKSLAEAVENFPDGWVIGGASIYAQAMSVASELYITHVDKEVKGDAYFPDIKQTEWKKVEEDINHGFSFCKYVRK